MGKKTPQPQERRAWDGTLRRQVDVQCRSVDEETRSVEVVASTDSLDSHGDILEQDWDLKRFKKNPVVLWNHNIFESSHFSFGGSVNPKDLLPIGRAENVRVQDGQLQAKLVFGSAEYNELSERVFRGFQEGMLRAVSVGFKPGKITEEVKNGKTVFRLADNELREISAVPIGSNPEAVAKSIAWERENMSRVAAKGAASRRHNDKGATMDEQELEKARVDLGVAQKQLTDERERTTKLEDDLKAEKTLTSKLQSDLDAANKRIQDADTARAKTELDALQGVKFAPAEREELDGMVKDLGLDRVVKYLGTRPDLAITKSVTAGSQPVAERGQPAAEPVDGADGGAELVKEINQRVKGAA